MSLCLAFSDGCAIAHAVSNYLKEKTQCRTIFSTHYHELTQEYSESQTKGVLIYHMNVMESPSEEVRCYQLKRHYIALKFFEKRFENCVCILLIVKMCSRFIRNLQMGREILCFCTLWVRDLVRNLTASTQPS